MTVLVIQNKKAVYSDINSKMFTDTDFFIHFELLILVIDNHRSDLQME